MPGMMYASSITLRSTSTHAFWRDASSPVVTALSTSASTAGSRTDRFELPPVSRMTRLSTICERNPKPSGQSAPHPYTISPRLFAFAKSGLPAYSLR